MTGKVIARYADLQDKSVFISGGATGIGEDLVRSFHAQGARVTFIDIADEPAQALCDALSSQGHRPQYISCDVTDVEALQAAVAAAADDAGVLDVLVNNAANDTRRDSLEVSSEEWDKSVGVNLKHQFFAAQAAFPFLKKSSGGSVINFSSIAPIIGIRDLTVYSTCKTAVNGLTRTLAREYGDHGIRVNAILPGCIITPRQLELWISEEDEKKIQADQCLHRRLIGDDVAQMALFLASDASSGCTSQKFVVDGGLVAG
ncbi:SDR family NAD(P)-dependent oxidoreductase [Rhodovibrionaceae bacterium A322]